MEVTLLLCFLWVVLVRFVIRRRQTHAIKAVNCTRRFLDMEDEVISLGLEFGIFMRMMQYSVISGL